MKTRQRSTRLLSVLMILAMMLSTLGATAVSATTEESVTSETAVTTQVMAFMPLEESVAVQQIEAGAVGAYLPETIVAVDVEGNEIIVPAEWECDDGYDTEIAGEYHFYLVATGEYWLEDGIEVPRIAVTVTNPDVRDEEAGEEETNQTEEESGDSEKPDNSEKEAKSELCELTEGCTLTAEHEGACVIAENESSKVVDEPVVVAEGDGYAWDEASKTLTVTAKDLSVIQSEIEQYADEVEILVINTTDDIPEKMFYADSGQSSYQKVREIQIKRAGNIGTAAFNNCGNSRNIMRNIKIERCGDIASKAFNRLNGAGGTLYIKECGNIMTDAFYYAKISQIDVIEKCGDIQSNAFRNAVATNNEITALEIGSCGSLADNAFTGIFEKLQTVRLGQVNGTIAKNALTRANGLVSIEIGICGDIAKDAFYNNQKLESLTIEKCGSLGGQTGLIALKHLRIDECKSIGNFYNYQPANVSSIETIEIGSCESIDSNAFQNAENLKTLKIGKAGSIGMQAFSGANALETLELKNCDTVRMLAFSAAGSNGNGIENLVLENVNLESNAFSNAKIENLTLINNGDIGNQAFVSATIRHLTLSNVTSLGKESFAYVKGMETLTIENLESIDEDSFVIMDDQVNAVKTITLRNVNKVGIYAFKNFSLLENVYITGNCEYIGAHAFTGCDNLKSINIADTTRLGYSDSFVNIPEVQSRVAAILAGGFDLVDTAQTIDEITADGWASVKIGKNNSTAKVGDTQLTKEAKWNDAQKTVADVQIKSYYTVNEQMDFVFVADCSNSMAGFGSGDALNSNFYNMQSKMMDVARELLSSSELNTRIAFATFGENQSSVSSFFEKGQADTAANYIWNDIVNYYSNTNYSHGLEQALKLVQQNKAGGRNTTVIFISDGQPYYDGSTIPEDYYGKAQADAIRAEGVKILSVLQQVPEGVLGDSQANMEKIADAVFASTDLAGFSEAINEAIDYAYTSYTLLDTIDPLFELEEDSIDVTAGSYVIGQDAAGNTTIEWTITDKPYEEHTMSFRQKLKVNETGVYPVGELDTNEGEAMLTTGDQVVNEVETPVLPRGTQVEVTKVWQGGSDENYLDSVEVVLLCNGKEFETVTLSAENNWQYSWLVDEAQSWTVEEVTVSDAFTTTVEQKDNAWTITNTYRPEEPEPEEPKPEEPKEGKLTISKEVRGNGGDQEREFTFTVTLKDQEGKALEGAFAYSGSKSGTIGNGKSVTLKHGESITIEGLPAGTQYSVSEEEAEGYEVSVTGENGTIEEGKTKTAAFVNTRNVAETSPETSDPHSPAKWWAVLIVAMAGVGAAVLGLRKSKLKRK